MQSWNTIKHQVRVSSLQWSILNAVRHAGFKVHPEYNDGLFSIDVAVFLESSNGEPIKASMCMATSLCLLADRWCRA